MCRLLGAALIVALVASLLSATAPRAEADAGLPTQTRLTLQGPTGVFQAGTAMTFTATVWPSDATGTVTFSVQYPDSIDIQPIATVPVTAGQATMTTNSLPASDNVSGVVISSFHSATSQYIDAAPGDPTNMWPVALTYLTPVVTLQLPANPAAGSQASATVTVRTPQAPTGAGTMVVDAAGGGRVQLIALSPDGLRPFSAETPVINGSASVPFAAPPVGGIHLIYAEYSGSRYARGADSAQQLLVPVPGTSIVLSTTATCPLTAGATIPVTAKVSPVATGSVQFSVHGSRRPTRPPSRQPR
jgi:hypothetical protein